MKSQQSRRTSRHAKQEAEQQAKQQARRRLIQAAIGLGLVLIVGVIVIVVTNASYVPLSCVGVKDPVSSVPTGGSQQQWGAPQQVVDNGHTYCAILKTDKGRIVIELYPRSAPTNVNSFVFLSQQGFYDNVTWHRVLSGFVAQTGDPTGTGMGGPGYNNLPLEIDPNLKYDRAGRVGMARQTVPTNSAGSQFFITYKALSSLDPHPPENPTSEGYTIIGQVVEGMDVAQAIKLRDPDQNPTGPGDPLVSVRVVDLTAAK